MKVMPTGIIFLGICKVQTSKCVATTGGPVTAVWTAPGRIQRNTCKPCLEEQIRQGKWIVEGARIRGMRQQALVDIAVYSPDNELQLIVEVKTQLGRSPDWANEVYSKVMDTPFLSEAPYFLLALPDRFYLWQQENTRGDRDSPYFTDKPGRFLEPSLAALSLKMEDISVSDPCEFRDEPYSVMEKHFYFQRIVGEWLAGIINSSSEKDLPGIIIQSGLYGKIAHGHIDMEAVIFPEPDIVVEGEQARNEDKPSSANPYNFNTERHKYECWQMGWEETNQVSELQTAR